MTNLERIKSLDYSLSIGQSLGDSAESFKDITDKEEVELKLRKEVQKEIEELKAINGQLSLLLKKERERTMAFKCSYCDGNVVNRYDSEKKRIYSVCEKCGTPPLEVDKDVR